MAKENKKYVPFLDFATRLDNGHAAIRTDKAEGEN